MLRSGIPIAGGIMATMYTAARLVSGGKSLAFGFLSGIILNQIGKLVDGIRKSRADIKEEKIEETENTKKKEENNQPISKEKR